MIRDARNGHVSLKETEMYYAAIGHGKRILVVLPGLSDGLATVQGKALLLAAPYRRFFERYTVYLFSRKNQMHAGYSIRQMAEDQAEAIRKLNLSKVSVLGVSEGGMIAQYLAIDHPELVEKLILAVSAPEANAIVRERVSHWIELVKENDYKQLMADTAEKSYSESYLHKNRAILPILGIFGKPKSFERFLVNAEAILAFNAKDEINQIICPTLIIGGSDDQIVGVEASYLMHDLIGKSTLYIYEGLGHATYEEADDFYDRVFSYLDE